MSQVRRTVPRVLLIKPGARVDVITYGKTALYGPVRAGILLDTFLSGRVARVRLDAVEGVERTMSYPSFRVTRA